MVKLMSSLVGRAYKFFDKMIHSRRHDMRLPMNLSLLESKTMPVSVPYSPVMSGYLCDISKTGLSLIVPPVRFGSCFIVGGHQPLRVTVELPNRVINIQVAPVRYDKLFEEQSERRYLIGARIMEMAESDREHLTQYIQQLKKRSSFGFAHGAPST